MTESNQPPNARGRGDADQDTTTLPRVSAPTQPGQSSGGWSPTVTRSGADANQTGNGARPLLTGSAANGAPPAAGRDARPAATATAVAPEAKGAMTNATAESDTKARKAPRTSSRAARQPRRARLTLSHINVYSVFKFSCVLAIALFFVWLIMVGVLYGVLDVAGVFNKINDTVHTISGDGKTNDVVTGSVVFGAAIIIGAVNIVLFIAMSTIGAMIYNLCADLVGGAELTLSERE
jgi:hypothetical protein